jgi:hypothetical protein
MDTKLIDQDDVDCVTPTKNKDSDEDGEMMEDDSSNDK